MRSPGRDGLGQDAKYRRLSSPQHALHQLLYSGIHLFAVQVQYVYRVLSSCQRPPQHELPDKALGTSFAA